MFKTSSRYIRSCPDWCVKWEMGVVHAVQVMLKVDESRGKIVNLAGPETLTWVVVG